MRKTLIGIEIGNTNIKIIKAKKKGGKYHILSAHRIDTPKGSVLDGYLLKPEEVTKAIKNTLDKHKIRTRRVYLSIDSSQIITREIEAPVSDNKYFKQILTYQIGDYLPIEPRDYQIDFQIIEPIEKDGLKALRVLAVAAPNELVVQYLQLGEDLQLKLKGMSINAANIGNVLNLKEVELKEQEEVLVVDIGGQVTDLTIIHGKVGRMTEKIGFGTMYLNEYILDEFEEEDVEMAEAFKKRYGAIYVEPDLEHNDFFGQYCSMLIRTVVEKQLIEEIRNFIEFYKLNTPQAQLKRIYVIGGGSCLTGIETYIDQVIGIEAKHITNIEEVGYTKEFEEELPYFINLIGLVKSA